MSNILRGTYTALVTPFINNNIDFKSLEKIIKFQIENNIDGIVIAGTTGECPTLTHKEHLELIKFSSQIIKSYNNNVKLIAGTGSNSTKEAIELSVDAASNGADALLLITPYYNKPTQKGLYNYYMEIDQNINIPIIIYNVPSRSCVDIDDNNIIDLINDSKNINSVKDASGDINRIINLYNKRKNNKKFTILSGDDRTIIPFMASGGDGVISVTSNIMPKEISEIIQYSLDGNFKTALEKQNKLLDLHDILFCETNPIMIKYACYLAGFIQKDIRSPLTIPSQDNIDILKDILNKFK